MKDTAIGFTVNQGENVTIDVYPSVGLGNNYTAVRDGDPAKDAFRWSVTKSAGQQHAVLMYFDFTGAGPGSQYRIVFNGDAAGNEGPFTRYVRYTSPTYQRNYLFPVV